MTYKALSDLSPQDKDAALQVQVNRKWEFRGIKYDGPILHIDMVLTDAMVTTNFPLEYIYKKCHHTYMSPKYNLYLLYTCFIDIL
jgi:hypothetical protein